MIKNIIIAVLAAVCVWFACLSFYQRAQGERLREVISGNDAMLSALRRSTIVQCLGHDTETPVSCQDRTPRYSVHGPSL